MMIAFNWAMVALWSICCAVSHTARTKTLCQMLAGLHVVLALFSFAV